MTINNDYEKLPTKILVLLKDILKIIYNIIISVKELIKSIIKTIWLFLLDLLEEVEIYQVIGGIGCLLLVIGSFSNLMSIKYYNILESVTYISANGAIISLLAVWTFMLIVFNKHKYCIVPGSFALAQNIAIRLCTNDIIEYVNFGYGYYAVWLGGILIVSSTFLINCGYKKDSGLRKNNPIYSKDILWICIIIVGAILYANMSAKTGVNSNYAQKIEEINTNIEDTYL